MLNCKPQTPSLWKPYSLCIHGRHVSFLLCDLTWILQIADLCASQCTNWKICFKASNFEEQRTVLDLLWRHALLAIDIMLRFEEEALPAPHLCATSVQL